MGVEMEQRGNGEGAVTEQGATEREQRVIRVRAERAQKKSRERSERDQRENRRTRGQTQIEQEGNRKGPERGLRGRILSSERE